MLRIGQGIDVHKLSKGIPLILGGELIEHNQGSVGHSDGDVLFHAITDALLGSIGKGDIGQHFPSNSKKWKAANSQIFIQHSYNLVNKLKYDIINIDCTIVLQKPRINNYIKSIKSNISKLLKINLENISIKATTTDHLGFIGKEQGICALALVLIQKKEECQ